MTPCTPHTQRTQHARTVGTVSRLWRWVLVGLGVTALAAAPGAAGALPVAQSGVSAQDLLAAVQNSAATPYSGYAQSTGGLVLPVTDQLSALTNLLGDTTTMRTWWRAADDWRVDTVLLSGERDLYRSQTGLWMWDYEANHAVLAPEPAARLPREADLLPTQLGLRLLSEVQPAEVSRLPTLRIAGREAPGLRLLPNDRQSTVTEVDVWADATTGLPLRVDVLGAGADRPVVTTSFLDFSTDVPDAATTRFTPPPGSDVHQQAATDIAAFADRLPDARAPSQLAGLAARDRLNGSVGAVGTYGRGVTALAAVPLPQRSAAGLRSQLAATPGAVTDADGVAVSVGPLSLRLTGALGGRRVWLLSGTVTADTLTSAARELAAGPPR